MTSTNKNAPIAKESNGGSDAKHQVSTNSSIKPFIGTTNIAELRAINTFIKAKGKQVSRKDLDRACGSSNSPEIVRRLRGKGLPIDCELKSTVNRFGEPVQAGYYSLTGYGHAKLRLWLRQKTKEAQE